MIQESIERLAEIEIPDNPFPGLRPFELHESLLFFGRESQNERLIEKLSRTRFLAIVGTSGSGKSSLVRAGLLPALLGGMMPSAGSLWHIALLRPGNDPVGNLARALNSRDAFGSEYEDNRNLQIAITEATLRRGNLGLIEAVRQANQPATENLLVIADQFEELFRVEKGTKHEELENDKAAFVKLLLEAARQSEVNIYVVLTMRSDYLGECAQFQDLPEAINESQYLIPRLTRDQLRQAITGPVAVGGAEMTPRLVNRLLNDIGDKQDQLPILQHALMRTWDGWKIKFPTHAKKHQGEAIDLCCYEATGGMDAALSRHADQAYIGLSNNRRLAIAEKLFKCLTEKGTDNREVRRPVTLREICAVVGAAHDNAQPAPEAEVIAVIEPFRAPGRSFLMPPAGTPLDADSLIDISHESLIRNWKRLSKWVEEEAISARRYLRLAETATLHKEDKAGLWRDPDLQFALAWQEQQQPNAAWAQRYFPDFALAMDFLTASRKSEEVLAQQVEAMRIEREEKRKQELGRTRAFATTISVLLLLAVGIAWFAWRQQQQAKAGEKRNRQLFYVANIQLAQKAFEEGYVGRGHELLGAIEHNAGATKEEDVRSFFWYYLWQNYPDELATLKGHTGTVSSVAFSSDGKTLATGSVDNTVKLWDVASRQELATLKGHTRVVQSVAFSSDDKTLATGSDDGTLKLWDVASRQQLATFKGHDDQVWEVAFSSDGKTLATGSYDGTVKLWDVVSRQELATLTGHDDQVWEVAFSRDGKVLATGSRDRTAKLWDVASRQELATLKGHTEAVSSITFSSDGKTLATGSYDETVKLWDMASRQELATLKGYTSSVQSVAFSSDGKMLATGSGDGMVKLWDVASRQELAALKGPTSIVWSVAFSSDGKTLATGSDDETVKLWDVASRQELATLTGHREAVLSVAFSSDGKTLASGSGDKPVKLWDVVSRQELATLTGHTSTVWSVAFSSDGKTLATGSDDGTVKLWDVASRQELATLKGHKGYVRSVAFSSDGKTLATSGQDQTVKLWDVASRQELATLTGHTRVVESVAFSRDGKTLATGSRDQIVKLWDVASRQELATLKGHDDQVWEVAFSSDGKTLATGSGDNTVKLWDVASRQELTTLKGHTDAVLSVTFSSDGKTLATGSADNTVKLWDMASRQELATLKGHTSEVWSVAFSSDGKTMATGSADKTVKLYTAATEVEVAAHRRLTKTEDNR